MEHFLELLRTFWTLLQQGQLPEVGRWNYLILALIVAIEGPIATLLGAAAASGGLMRPWAVFLAASLGNLTADSLWYMAGYSGKLESAVKIGKWLGVKKAYVERLQVAMQKHGVKILFFAKLTAGFMIPSLIAAGLIRLPWKKWLPVLVIGETIWTGLLVLIGYYTTVAVTSISKDLTVLVGIASVLFLIFMIWEGRRILWHTQEFNEAIHYDSGSGEQKK